MLDITKPKPTPCSLSLTDSSPSSFPNVLNNLLRSPSFIPIPVSKTLTSKRADSSLRT